MDIYGAFEQRYYDSMTTLAGSTHPIALAEVGAMPTLDVLAKQPRWAYFMMWSGMAESSNTPQQLAAMFHAPNVINRGDARLPAPLPAPTAAPLPVTDDAIPAAQTLLARLYATRDKFVLSGQQVGNAPAKTAGPTSAVEAVVPTTEAAARNPALVEFTISDPSDTTLLPAVREASRNGQIVLLRWLPGRPTDGAQTGTLTDFEWQELTRSGTELNTRWTVQADAVAALLQQLQKEHIAVVWSPYPALNTQTHWWAGRPGPEGSAAIIRMLYERLATHDGLRNLVWAWEPAMPGFGPGGNGGFADYYPGPLYADVVTLDVETLAGGRFHADRMLQSFAGGKPIGVRVASAVPTPAVVNDQTGWQWIVVPPATPANVQALNDFYSDSRVISMPSK
jgi:mannan endo-1,4-beta-mannosidase